MPRSSARRNVFSDSIASMPLLPKKPGDSDMHPKPCEMVAHCSIAVLQTAWDVRLELLKPPQYGWLAAACS